MCRLCRALVGGRSGDFTLGFCSIETRRFDNQFFTRQENCRISIASYEAHLRVGLSFIYLESQRQLTNLGLDSLRRGWCAQPKRVRNVTAGFGCVPQPVKAVPHGSCRLGPCVYRMRQHQQGHKSRAGVSAPAPSPLSQPTSPSVRQCGYAEQRQKSTIMPPSL
jgi:hypothetical protein